MPMPVGENLSLANSTGATASSGAERPEVSFIVPCYNEAGNVFSTVAEIDTAAKLANLSTYEIVIVDDCSSDATPKEIGDVRATNPSVHSIRNATNKGFGGSYKEGVAVARGQYVMLVPGDNQYPANSIAVIIKLRGCADMVVPFVTNDHIRPIGRRIFSWGFTTLLNVIFGFHLPYYNGLVLYSLDRLRTIEIVTNSFAYQAEALVKLLSSGCNYVAVGSPIRMRPVGKSSAFKMKNVIEVLRCLWRLRMERSQSIVGS